MSLKLSSLSKMIALSIGFSMTLLLVRFLFTREFSYKFYIWNSFLAVVPYVFSTLLTRWQKLTLASGCLLAGWLLFFPNAPYMITDLFHFEERPPVPAWFDLIIVMVAAWNGLILGIVSLMQVENFLSKRMNPLLVKIAVFISFILCAYGIFMGRYLRYNSWDIFTKPGELVSVSAHHLLLPYSYKKVWVFTFLFAILLSLVYFTLKKLPHMIVEQQTKAKKLKEPV